MANPVTIDEHRIARVASRGFFPIAARHVPIGADSHILAQAGFNAVRWTPFGVDMFEGRDIEPPRDLGPLKFYAYVFNRGDLATDAQKRQKELVRLVESVRDHPNLLAYEQRNEPAGTFRNPSAPQSTPEGLIAGSRIIRELDPHHPICVGYSCGNLVSTLKRYNPAVDIVGCNPYVVLPPHVRQFIGLRPDGRYVDSADQTLSAVGLHTDKMMRVADGRPVWMQIQGASNENWHNADHTPEQRGQGLYEYQRLNPNRWQMRFMAWQAIVCGATGLTWMLHGLSVDDAGWQDVIAVVRELRALHDVLASPSWPGRLQIKYEELGFSDWSGIQMSVKLHDGVPFILAVNSQFDPMIASVSNLPPEVGDKLQVIGEQRTIEMQNGAFRDRFQPYEVHLYAPAS
jgi:hypothetical protein